MGYGTRCTSVPITALGWRRIQKLNTVPCGNVSDSIEVSFAIDLLKELFESWRRDDFEYSGWLAYRIKRVSRSSKEQRECSWPLEVFPSISNSHSPSRT